MSSTTAARPLALRAFLGTVAVAVIVPLALLAASAGKATLTEAPPVFWLLVAFVVAGELLPIKVPGHDDELTTSTPFIYALLLTCGIEAAAIAQALACLVADARIRRPLSAAFNVGSSRSPCSRPASS